MNPGKVDRLTIYTLSEDYSGYDSPFWGSFGISFLLHIECGEGEKKILFDTASDAEPVLHNMKLFGISPENIDVIFLSHRHFDHTGGLAGILKEIGREEVPIIAHPEVFGITIMPKPYLEPYRSHIYLNQGLASRNSKENIEALGGRWYLVRDPMHLMTGVTTTGEIGTAEKVAHEKEPYIRLLDIEGGNITPALIRDDISLIVNTPKGLVIITGCSHAGIISIVKKAVSITGISNVAGVVGGLHLLDAGREAVDQTINDLKEIHVEKIYAGHCTGFEAEYKLRQIFSKDFERLCSGKVIVF